ncbi:MAG: hypothetical protein L3K02_03815, partial [Thermoplasmata archaeon]|nr:hypothetical protein [Thermoplasmata archaeon]
MALDEVKIRDLSRPNTSEWTPPIGAMGGPPAHELYRDLVAHGGLRLMRDRDGNPWVEMQDGERRRSFRVPGVALRGALDRFRMRRNLRPAPETDLEDFARVVSARVSDPDVRLPAYDLAASERAPPAPEPPSSYAPPSPPSGEADPEQSPLEEELARVIEEVDSVRASSTTPSLLEPAPAGPRPAESPPAPWLETPADLPVIAPSLGSLDATISGGKRIAAGR